MRNEVTDITAAGQYGEVRDGQLYGPPGGIAGHAALQGFEATRRNASAQHNRRVTEAARLYADVLSGREEPILLQQAIRPTYAPVVQHLAEKYPGLYPQNGARWDCAKR